MAKVPNAVEILPKIWTAWVGRTNVTDDRRQTDGRQQIANVNVSSRSLKPWYLYDKQCLACVEELNLPPGTTDRKNNDEEFEEKQKRIITQEWEDPPGVL